jgi:hypothetical protein
MAVAKTLVRAGASKADPFTVCIVARPALFEDHLPLRQLSP